jgi:chemotaxis protein MotB
MRYSGWILALILAAAGVAGYFIFYAPLQRGYAEQEAEIKMWTAKVAALQEGRPLDTMSVSDSTVALDTASIRAKGKGELDKLLPVLKTSQGDVAIMVHTDNVRVSSSLRDRYPTNWELSALRAAVIARYLLDRGIDYKRLVPCGISAARPLASNSTSEGRAKNRRVEVYLR